MSANERLRTGLIVGLCIGTVLLPARVIGQGGESVGMITEIKVGRGRVEVKPAGGAAWRAAGPLLALRAGDTVRATENATVVVLLTGGRGTLKVDAANSPLVVTAGPPGSGKLEKARTLVEGSLGFLTASAKEPPKAVLSVRAGARPPVILSPRRGPVLPGPLAFEWLGSQFSRYTVRIAAPSGPVLERKGVVGARFEYPADAPALTPGTRYTLQVVPASGPTQEASFEVMDAGRARTVRQNLKDLEETLGPTVSPNTLVALRVGVLAGEGLLHDARRAVLASLAKDPDEPTLHWLLGNVYLNAGLPEQAAESFDEAQFLLTRGAN